MFFLVLAQTTCTSCTRRRRWCNLLTVGPQEDSEFGSNFLSCTPHRRSVHSDKRFVQIELNWTIAACLEEPLGSEFIRVLFRLSVACNPPRSLPTQWTEPTRLWLSRGREKKETRLDLIIFLVVVTPSRGNGLFLFLLLTCEVGIIPGVQAGVDRRKKEGAFYFISKNRGWRIFRPGADLRHVIFQSNVVTAVKRWRYDELFGRDSNSKGEGMKWIHLI